MPKKLAVIGGGYIGLEMGSVWSRLGSEVTVIEYLENITPNMDREISIEFKKILIKQGIKFKMGSKVNSVQNQGSDVLINYILIDEDLEDNENILNDGNDTNQTNHSITDEIIKLIIVIDQNLAQVLLITIIFREKLQAEIIITLQN